MRSLTVLYDGDCGLCLRARDWLRGQPKFLAMEFVAQNSDAARARYPQLVTAEPPEELIVVSDDGSVYREGNAWIMCLYALRDYRALALRLGRPGMRGLARRAFAIVSRHRHRLGRWLPQAATVELASALRKLPDPPRCEPVESSTIEAMRRVHRQPPPHQCGVPS
ncbi:MAG: DUF393 domain-containing protein [Phycisphaeraceae bacterium]